MTTFSILFSGCVFFSLLVPVYLLGRGAFSKDAPHGRFFLLALGSGILIVGGLSLRPHQDTFVGLDTSCYRNMARAFEAGRGFHDVDTVLAEVPSDLRRSFLLEYIREDRDTRDRSFRITSLDTCRTEPFFYPMLSLAAAGLETVFPGGMDYFVPIVGLIFFVALVFFATAVAGPWAALTVPVLWLATPFPIWFVRGFFAESVAACLAITGLMLWAAAPVSRSTGFVAGLVLGLSMSFHPLAVFLALPGLILLLLTRGRGWRSLVAPLAGFSLGLAPLIWATAYVCQPYGNFLDPGSLLGRDQPRPQQLVRLAALGIVGLVGAFMLAPTKWREGIVGFGGRLAGSRWVGMAGLVAVIALVCVAVHLFLHRDTVLLGWRELVAGVRFWPGLAAGIAVCALLAQRNMARAKALLLLAVGIVPIFLYLKGVDQVGFWSQRRLILPVLLFITVVAPCLALVPGWRRDRRLWVRRSLTVVWLIFLVTVALASPIRWSAPWLLRSETGVDVWIREARDIINDRLTFFDYHHYSLPFAVLPGMRVLGLGQEAEPQLDKVMQWLVEQGRIEPVLIGTAWSNPGLELGVALNEVGKTEMEYPVIRSRHTLPAEPSRRRISVAWLELTQAEVHDPPSLDKILDGGPLALRGRWGRSDIALRSPEGEALPARWTRQGSKVVGPVPLPGQAVSVQLTAGAYRGDALDHQVILVEPPWGGDALELRVENPYTVVSGTLRRPKSDVEAASATDVYTLKSQHPYNPEAAGIRGFHGDLGVLLHRIRIHVECPDP